ncbi:MAG: hypothetical protein ACREQI_14100 [Candidatus Binataceae bacterium]
MRKIRGFVTVTKWHRGRRIWTIEKENLIVTAGLGPIGNLLGGAASATNAISVVGFGSGNAAPAITDVDLTPPAYYKAGLAVSNPSSGQAQFTWSLSGATSPDTGDWQAVGMNVTELAFFANTGSLGLPINRPSGAAPNLTMIGHILLNLGTIESGGNYTGTWTFVA